MTFEDWKNEVDTFLVNRCGLSSMDLPDCDYWNMWNDGLPSCDAAQTALEEAGFYN